MPILLRNVRLALEAPEEALWEQVARRLRVPLKALRAYAIVGRSLDARNKDDIHFRYQVEVALRGARNREQDALRRLRANEARWIAPIVEHELTEGTDTLSERPIIIGFGPAGMFAGLCLAELGYKPLILERGRSVRQRHRDVLERFFREGRFDPESNLLFGEGGAGTYSDGKLYTRVRDPLVRTILDKLYHHGADPDILVDARPHIGSEKLPKICWRIRETIENLGGEVRFEARVDRFHLSGGCLDAIDINEQRTAVGPVLLAIGHSARDTYHLLSESGVRLEPKPFQLGVRIEHPQAMVDHWQYGSAAGHRRLQAAEYHLVAKGASPHGGDLFSFCMCPGGVILPTNESANLVATNGASPASRGGPFANSGLVMTMDPARLGVDALGALAYQERWERAGFEATGGGYRVPAQRACDFLEGRPSEGTLETSYPLGGRWVDIRGIIPSDVAVAVEKGLQMLDRKLPGFAGGDAVVTAPETRASAPVRIVRDSDTRLADGVDNLYPAGEGAGYAGGIISAAVDGLRSAHAIVTRYRRP